MHQLIEPSDACRRVGHRIDSRLKQGGSGRFEFCTHCSLGYELAMARFNGDEVKADEFVRVLRHG